MEDGLALERARPQVMSLSTCCCRSDLELKRGSTPSSTSGQTLLNPFEQGGWFRCIRSRVGTSSFQVHRRNIFLVGVLYVLYTLLSPKHARPTLTGELEKDLAFGLIM